MARNFDGKNSDSSLRAFFNRANYNINSFRDLSVNTDHVTDFSLGELRLYGRISNNQSFVIPQKNAMKSFKGFDQSIRPIKAINFVSDAADAMSRQFIKQTLTSNKVENDSSVVSLTFERGSSDPLINYELYISQLNNIFIDKLFKTRAILKVTDFDSFFDAGLHLY